jgi:hypothetical protein
MQPKTTAKDFFLYLAVFVGLYASTISFLTLAFAIIEKVFPLPGEYYLSSDGAIRNSIAILIIFLPAFIWISRFVNKDLKSNVEKKDIWVRKWLIYFTLFIAGLTVAIDLVTLINEFLSGNDLNLRFFLKVLLVLITAISIFRYYLYDLKRNPAEFKNPAKTFVWSVSAVALLAIVYGVILVGSPAMQRAKNMDQQRVSDLMDIQSQVIRVWQAKGVLPKTLAEMNDPLSNYTVPKDPKTNQDFEYKTISATSFELCATFETKSDPQITTMAVTTNYSYPMGTVNENWQHDAGRTCFDRTIDTKLYPVDKTVK